jgi:L-alanine-DL-glutamate epimerase-like enolase superfamily enzyme
MTSWRCLKLEAHTLALPLRWRFRHAATERRHNETVIIVLHTTGGIGYGEVLPRAYVTGESVAGVLTDLRDVWWPRLKDLTIPADSPPFDVMAPLSALAHTTRRTAGYGGIDLAVFDAWAQAARVPGSRMLGGGGERGAVPLTATIGMSGPAGLMAKAARHLGFAALKVKVGDAGDDARVEAVRRAAPSLPLTADANGAWDEAMAKSRQEQLARLGVSALEEPLGKRDAAAWRRLKDVANLPLVADESVCTLDDAMALASPRAADIWNLRLGKVGGFSGMQAMLQLTKKYGVGWRLGTLVGETAILAAAQRAALQLGTPAGMEFGFQRLLGTSVFATATPAPWITTTLNGLGEAYGLGVTVDKQVLERYAAGPVFCLS